MNENPDLVLLDIQMDDGTGFDLLKKAEPINFKVIFITAFDQYAIQAFKFSAIDYLLKPVDPEDLVQAVNRAEQMVQQDFSTQLKVLDDNLKTQETKGKKIILRTSETVHLVKVMIFPIANPILVIPNFTWLMARKYWFQEPLGNLKIC